jgi:hypothetical protein
MTALEVLATLQAAGVSVTVVDGERLSLVPKPPGDLLGLVRTHKASLLIMEATVEPAAPARGVACGVIHRRAACGSMPAAFRSADARRLDPRRQAVCPRLKAAVALLMLIGPSPPS